MNFIYPEGNSLIINMLNVAGETEEQGNKDIQ